MNQITSYLDGSATYGSSEDEQHEMRTHKDGKSNYWVVLLRWSNQNHF